MQKWINILVVLFLVQLVASVYTSLREDDIYEAQASSLLGITDPLKIDKLKLTDHLGKVMTLVKVGESWRVEGHEQLKLNERQLSGLLDDLVAAKRDWPVATTKNAAPRFFVDDAKYKRKILVFAEGQEVGELIFGSSPSFRKIHGRLSGDVNIYAIRLNAFQASVELSDWLDRKILHAEKGLTRIQIASLELVKENKQWKLAKIAPEEKHNQKAVKKLVTNLATVDVSRVLKKEELVGLAEPTQRVVFQFESTEGEAVPETTFDVYELNGMYILKSSLLDYYFEITKNEYRVLTQVERQRFFRDKASADAQNETVVGDSREMVL